MLKYVRLSCLTRSTAEIKPNTAEAFRDHRQFEFYALPNVRLESLTYEGGLFEDHVVDGVVGWDHRQDMLLMWHLDIQ